MKAIPFEIIRVNGRRLIDRDILAALLMRGVSVRIQGLGTFSPSKRSARTVRHPKTRELLTVPEKHTVYFKAAKRLRLAREERAKAGGR